MGHNETQHTIFNETAEGKWTYTRQDRTSLPFPTLREAEGQEKEAYEHQGTATYHFITLQGKKHIGEHLNPFGDNY